jgi:hypothetical protein
VESESLSATYLSDPEQGLVVHGYNSSIQEAEARGSQIQGQAGLRRVTLSQGAKRAWGRPKQLNF